MNLSRRSQLVPRCLSLALAVCAGFASRNALAADSLFLTSDPDTRISGQTLVEAQDGGVLFQDRAGTIVAYQPDEIARRESSTDPFTPFDAETLGASLVEEFGPAFRVHQSDHYVVAYDTHPVFAKWVAGMLEKLHGAFYAFWEREGIELTPPEFPLPVVLFKDKASYTEGTRGELGDQAGKLVSFYSLKSNRVFAYDVTEVSAQAGVRFDLSLLRRPAMLANVTNVVHESTHQIAFNSGLQHRFAGHPLWYSEGMATYFEAPDFSSNRGWRTVGAINLPRLVEFRRDLPRRRPGTLATMIGSDERFRDPAVAVESYAEAWTFIYWAYKHRSQAMTDFAKSQQELAPLAERTAEERVAEFEKAFGESVDAIERAFVEDAGRMR